MLRRRTFAALLLLAAAAGCASSLAVDDVLEDDGLTPRTVIPVVRLRAEPYSFSYHSGMGDSARVVVRTEAVWREAWARIWARHSPEQPLPAVDFSSEMIVVAALGTRATGGHGIYVDSAYQRLDHVEVLVRKESPGRNCGTTQALTQPVDVARLPASAQPVRFRERSLVRDC